MKPIALIQKTFIMNNQIQGEVAGLAVLALWHHKLSSLEESPLAFIRSPIRKAI